MTVDTDALKELLSVGLRDALLRQRQIDKDGVEVGVSREALYYACLVLGDVPALIAEVEELRHEVAIQLGNVKHNFELAEQLQAENAALRERVAVQKIALQEIMERSCGCEDGAIWACDSCIARAALNYEKEQI